jgi:NDP-sugar pyrophosphorylase family protein
MAAGRGQRMMPLTAGMPKAMAPFGGSTLIRQGIRELRKHLPYVHITVGYKGAMLAEHVILDGVSSVFNTEGRANCWWVYNTVLKVLDEPVFVLTCDNVAELDFEMLEKDYGHAGEPACMVVPVKPVDGFEGDYITCDGNLVVEIGREKRTDLYCSGIQILNPWKVNRLTRESEDFYCLWRQLIGQEQLKASQVYPRRWVAVDTVDQLIAAQQV